MHKMLLGVAFLAVLPVYAQSPKKAWMLTLEERIALRTNPELARERVRVAKAADAARGIRTSAEAREPVDSFDGRSHPELFLPHEIFRSFMTSAFHGTPRTNQNYRRALMPEVLRIGLPTTFWERIESLAAIYIADSLAEADILSGFPKLSGEARERSIAVLRLKQKDLCRSRADAIAAARKEFGVERFDRLLYEVIAVHKFHSEDHPLNAEVLRWVERGCR